MLALLLSTAFLALSPDASASAAAGALASARCCTSLGWLQPGTSIVWAKVRGTERALVAHAGAQSGGGMKPKIASEFGRAFAASDASEADADPVTARVDAKPSGHGAIQDNLRLVSTYNLRGVYE